MSINLCGRHTKRIIMQLCLGVCLHSNHDILNILIGATIYRAMTSLFPLQQLEIVLFVARIGDFDLLCDKQVV